MIRPTARAATVLALTLAFLSANVAAVSIEVTGWVEERDRAIIEAFTQAHPEIEVNYRNLFGGDALLVQLVGGSGPDVMILSWAYVGDFLRSGLLLDLTPLIERDRLDMDDFFPAGLETARFGGAQYGLPASMGGSPLFVNLDLYEEAGLPLPPDDWTWEDLAADARKLTRKDGAVTTQWGFANIGVYNTYLNILYSFGGRVLSPDFSRVTFNTPQTRDALTFIQRLSFEEGVAAAGNGPFQSGTAAISFYFSDTADAFFAANNLRTKAVMSPLGPGGRTLVGGSHQIAINSRSEDIEAAWTFVKFYTGTEAQAIPLQQGYPPVRRSSLDLAPVNETMEIIARQIGSSYQPTNTRWAVVSGALNAAVAALIEGRQSPVQAAESVHDQLEAAWQDMN